MSLKGGYKIIDLKGVDVTKSTLMIKGIYESIESNYGKPLLISGIVIDGVEKDDVFVQATLNGTTYEFEVYGYTIQVQDTDAVGVKQYVVLQVPTKTTTIELKNGDKFILLSGRSVDKNYRFTFSPLKCEGIYLSTGTTIDNFELIRYYANYELSVELDVEFALLGENNYSVIVKDNKIYVSNICYEY